MVLRNPVAALSRADRIYYAKMANGFGFLFFGAAALYWLLLRLVVRGQFESAGYVQESVSEVEKATVLVQSEVRRLAEETARAQQLAITVGVGTAVLGAILGAFAGAFAARLVG